MANNIENIIDTRGLNEPMEGIDVGVEGIFGGLSSVATGMKLDGKINFSSIDLDKTMNGLAGGKFGGGAFEDNRGFSPVQSGGGRGH